jgi:hypothetical protein
MVHKDVVIILEELFIEDGDDTTIKVLWQDSEHLLLFRKFYSKLIKKCSKTKICKLFPIDIRLNLFEISPEEIVFNLDDNAKKNLYLIQVKKYFENLDYLFNADSITTQSNSVIKFIKKVFNIYSQTNFYKELKKRIDIFFLKYKINSCNLTIYQMIKQNKSLSNYKYEESFPYIHNHSNFIDDLDKIASGIMEMYSLILILILPNPNVIYYAGYYHSNNIAYMLEKNHNFVNKYSSGITSNVENHNNVSNCLEIQSEYINFI